MRGGSLTRYVPPYKRGDEEIDQVRVPGLDGLSSNGSDDPNQWTTVGDLRTCGGCVVETSSREERRSHDQSGNPRRGSTSL